VRVLALGEWRALATVNRDLRKGVARYESTKRRYFDSTDGARVAPQRRKLLEPRTEMTTKLPSWSRCQPENPTV
jgi:hypothetical protein